MCGVHNFIKYNTIASCFLTFQFNASTHPASCRFLPWAHSKWCRSKYVLPNWLHSVSCLSLGFLFGVCLYETHISFCVLLKLMLPLPDFLLCGQTVSYVANLVLQNSVWVFFFVFVFGGEGEYLKEMILTWWWG